MVSETLRTLREDLGFSQNYIAEQLNISPQSISKWERGESLPSIEYLPQLAKIFHCKIDDLFDKFPYNALEEDVFFAILKEGATKKTFEKARKLLSEKPLLEEFLFQLNHMLATKKFLFENELMETFNFGYHRSKKVIADLIDLGFLITKQEENFIIKERLTLFEKLLYD